MFIGCFLFLFFLISKNATNGRKEQIMVNKNYQNMYRESHQKRTHKERRGINKNEAIHQKFIVVDTQTGKRTTGITLSKGRIAIGDDVWRISNRADMCEYPFKIVDNYEFQLFYKKENAPYSFKNYMTDERNAI